MASTSPAFRDGTGLVDFLATADDAEIIVLDWNLPRVSGIDLLPQAAARRHQPAGRVPDRTQRSPTTSSSRFDRGALDFVDKARGVPILAQRLRLIVDRAEQAGVEPTAKATSIAAA